MEFIPIVAGIVQGLGSLFGLGGRQPPSHIINTNDALVKTQAMAIEKAEQNLKEARTEAAKSKAAFELEIQKKAMAKAPVTDAKLIEKARLEYGLDCVNELNILISGDTGSGKSSFINCVLNQRPGQPGSAEVGITETTVKMKPYFSAVQSFLKLWDAPGCGTTGFPFFHFEDPELHYYRRFCLYAFNMVIFFYSGRMLQGTSELARTCLEAGQPVVIVRNKADAMVNDLLSNGAATNEEQAKDMARNAFKKEILKELKDDASRIPHFLVSIYKYRDGKSEFDEEALFKHIDNVVRKHALGLRG